MKTIFILSTKAGSFRPDLENEMREKFDSQDLIIYKSQYAGHIKELVEKHANEPCHIFICGGDGSVSEAATCLVNKKAVLGLIPAGTANDFAKNFDYSTFSLESAKDPNVGRCDLIQVNDSLGINVVSFGLDTLILSKTYKLLKIFPFLKKRAYNLAIIWSLFQIKSLTLYISLELEEGQKIEVNNSFILGALCNGGYYGGGFNPSPKAKIDDGILELVLAQDLSLIELIGLIPSYKKGQHLTHPKVALYRVKKGIIKGKTPLLWNIDGFIYEDKCLSFSVLPQAIKWAYL